jgi:predicted DNA-binding transcriptional regulator AlpA
MSNLENYQIPDLGLSEDKEQSLPKRFLSRKQVLELTTWSVSTLRRREKEGLFPQHVQDKGRALYPEDEVLACIEEMKRGRGETAWQLRREERKQQAEILQREQAMAKSRAELEALAHAPRIRPRAPTR